MIHTSTFPIHWFGKKRDKITKQPYDLNINSKLNIMKGILENGFKFFPCSEKTKPDTYTVDKLSLTEELKFTSPMISFSDIPEELANYHCSKYGQWGIGMSRDWLIKNRGQPVIYRSYDKSDSLSYRMLQLWRVLNPGEEKDFKQVLTNFRQVFGNNSDFESLLREITHEFFFSSKMLDHEDGILYGNYLEREWRITWEPGMQEFVRFNPSDIQVIFYDGGEVVKNELKKIPIIQDLIKQYNTPLHEIKGLP